MTPPTRLTERLAKRLYHDVPGWRNGTVEFHDLIASCAPPGARLGELGCGPSNETSDFLATLGSLDGFDIDASSAANRALARFGLIENGALPAGDATLDIVSANYVLEHLEKPGDVFREVARVLKPGGAFVFRTPNRWHYVALVAAITPHSFHRATANLLRALPEGTHEPWRTFYRANSNAAVRELARASGFEIATLGHVEKEPSYGIGFLPIFLAGVAWERIVNVSDVLAGLRANLFGVLRRR